MSKPREEYISEIVKTIQDNPNIVKVSYIFNKYTQCSSANFYKLELEKVEDIKQALEQNRVNMKDGLLQDFVSKDASPVLKIAAFKLIGDIDERKKLSQTFVETTGKVNHLHELSDAELNRQLEKAKGNAQLLSVNDIEVE